MAAHHHLGYGEVTGAQMVVTMALNFGFYSVTLPFEIGACVTGTFRRTAQEHG